MKLKTLIWCQIYKMDYILLNKIIKMVQKNKKQIWKMIIILIIANIGLIKAQYTAIPDVYFEQHLIDLNIDTEGIIDGQVLTIDINSITLLTMNGIDNSGNEYGVTLIVYKV